MFAPNFLGALDVHFFEVLIGDDFIDTERGIENDQYVKLLVDNGGVVFQTTDFD